MLSRATTVVRYHANIHAALESAMADGLIANNAAHKQRPMTEKYIGSFYMPVEALECMYLAEGSKLELAVYFGLFYGLRNRVICNWMQFSTAKVKKSRQNAPDSSYHNNGL